MTMTDFYAYSTAFDSLAKSSRFAVRITPSGTDNQLIRLGYTALMQQFTYLCEAAELPGRGFMKTEQSYHGPVFSVPYQTQYSETSMTFLCRTQSFERQFFDDWMEIINPTDTFDFEYKDRYKCQIHLYQFGEGGRRNDTAPLAQYAWTLHDAYPILINPQPVTWADDNFQRLAVAFSFSKWTRERDPKPLSYSLVRGANVTV